MTVRQQDVRFDRTGSLFDEPPAKSPYAAPRVENDQTTIRATNLHTGRIPPVSSSERTGARNGAARPPESKAKTHEWRVSLRRGEYHGELRRSTRVVTTVG